MILFGKTQEKVFFSGRATKCVGKPPWPLSKYPAVLAQKLGRKRKNCQNPLQAAIRPKKREKKVAWTTKPMV
jgi:hypothetical protein